MQGYRFVEERTGHGMGLAIPGCLRAHRIGIRCPSRTQPLTWRRDSETSLDDLDSSTGVKDLMPS